jgi:hypothetical protein
MTDESRKEATMKRTGFSFKDWETCEANYRGLEQANNVNYHLMLWEQSKWKAIYRLVFPEEAPWGRVQLSPGVTCSPYLWEKLILRLNELLLASGKEPADGWQGAGGKVTDESRKEFEA